MSQLVVDPITKATYIDNAYPSTNYGTTDIISVSFKPISSKFGPFIARVLQDADISAIPPGSIIVSTSKLELYCKTVYAATAATLYRITQPDWTELGATWGDYIYPNDHWYTPGGDYSTPSVAFTTPAATGWFTITGADFAAFLQDAINNRSGIARMLLRVDTESDTLKGADFASDDDTHDPSWKLKLTVDYTEGGAAYVESYGCMF